MRLGLCTNAILNAGVIAPSGLDYVEEHVQNFLKPAEADAAGEAAFADRLNAASQAARPIPAACCFLPATLRCTGPDIDHGRLLDWARVAFRRAERAGVRTIVFGSAGARMLPPGCSVTVATDQFAEVLTAMAPIALAHGVTIVVEPLNRGECNFLNTVREGAAMVRRVGHPSVRLLVDVFHMLRNDEDPSGIAESAGLIHHAHIAEREVRSLPGVKGDDFRPYLRALLATGYDGNLSMEPGQADLATQLAPAIATLRQQIADARRG